MSVIKVTWKLSTPQQMAFMLIMYPYFYTRCGLLRQSQHASRYLQTDDDFPILFQVVCKYLMLIYWVRLDNILSNKTRMCESVR